ncbi:hypothetical protein LOK49_LG04G00669 [Camellia lanceoleosa]|uniref:Uncharacterized protein n=1 Tax=Camellia lanceoleosa TaxID=1840588 RepID=A0ACC0HZ26_9ERIC|nr:hypothetical protein LOK49_LG04G00669 [Camellia lanceoleosa]
MQCKEHINVDKNSHHKVQVKFSKSPAESPETVARLFAPPFGRMK